MKYQIGFYKKFRYVDHNNVLQLSNPNLKAKDMKPFCSCCTHTFNGKLFGSE